MVCFCLLRIGGDSTKTNVYCSLSSFQIQLLASPMNLNVPWEGSILVVLLVSLNEEHVMASQTVSMERMN